MSNSNRKIITFIFAAIFSVCCLFAQDESEWYWNKPISKIEFEGLKNVRKSELTGITSSYIGIDFTESSFNELLDRLYALDLFVDITPFAKHLSKNSDEVLLVFQVEESPVISSITFSGNKKIRNGELRELIKAKTSDVYVESKILLDERTLRDHYLEKGYTASKVTHTAETTDDGVKIVFHIDEGANTVIKKIQTQGNTIVSERSLKMKLKSKELGLLKDGAYQISTVEQDKQVILNYYQERGYIDVAVLDVKVDSVLNESKGRRELTLTYIIQEGSKYTYGGIEITGNEVFTTDQLLSYMTLKKGDVFNNIKFQEGLTGIAGLYYENGYMANDFYPVPSKDIEHHEISYNLTIRENVRSHIENIIVKGNTKTKDYVITREIPLEPGDVFCRDKVVNGLRNLYNLQYFSNILPEPQQGSEANLVDLVVTVEEQSTTAVQFGMTFSGVTDPNAIPISLYAKVENTNLFGEGKSISASTTISNVEQSVDFAYSQRWIGKLPVSFSSSLSFAHKQSSTTVNRFLPDISLDQYYYYMNYDGWTASLNNSLSRRWTPDYAILTLAGGMSNSLTNYVYNENIYSPVNLGISLFANRWGVLNSLWGSFSVDARDINYDPTKGWFASERLGWYGLVPGLEKEFFLRSETTLEGYLKLLDIPITDTYSLKMVLAGFTTVTGLFPVPGCTISESNRLYIDGMFNGRGWTEAYKNSAAKGQAMFSNRVELRVPVVPNMLGIDGFWDAVAVKPTFDRLVNSTKIEDFYFSFGPGIRFLIQQLPLHLLFAFRYRVVDGKPKMADNPFQFVLSFNIVNK